MSVSDFAETNLQLDLNAATNAMNEARKAHAMEQTQLFGLSAAPVSQFAPSRKA